MPRFAANLSFLYTELPFLDRFEAAAKDGFQAVEFMSPYEHAAPELRDRLRLNGLQLVLFNTPAGGTDAAAMAQAWATGMRGVTCHPGQQAVFQHGVQMALHYAVALDCPRIHILAGCVPEDLRSSPELAVGLGTGVRLSDQSSVLRTTFEHNLRWAADQAAQAGCEVLIEPINRRDIPGYYLNFQADAHATVLQLGCDNLKVQMDLYHCQVVEGDVAMKLRHYLPTGRVGHIQIAGAPMRCEPDLSEQHYPYLFQVLDEVSASAAWSGWVGCEYRPSQSLSLGDTSDSLSWLRQWRSQPAN